jgi:capsular polysaccharide transport system permease protein
MPEAMNPASRQSLTVAGAGQTLPETLEDAQAVSQAISRALRRAARDARAPARILSGGLGESRRGAQPFKLAVIASFVALVICPLVFATVYWGVIASRQYSTEMKFAIRSGQSSPLDSLGGMFGMAGSPQNQDTQIVADFVRSRAMVEALDKSLDLHAIYTRPGIDILSRLDADAPVEELEKYWRKRVDVKVDSLSGIVAIDVRAFTPEDSLAIGSKILALSETLVNDLSTRSRRDALAQAQSELNRAEQRLQAATAAMRDVRDQQGVLDAGAAADGLNKIIVTLRLELSRAEQDLASQGGGSDDAPQSRVIHARMASLKAQIDDYSQQIAGLDPKGSSSMATRLSLLSRRQTDLDLARQNYAQASATFENARVDLETQHAYLVTSMRPILAQKSTYPRRWWEWSIVVFPCLLGWAIFVGIAFLIRNNMAK